MSGREEVSYFAINQRDNTAGTGSRGSFQKWKESNWCRCGLEPSSAILILVSVLRRAVWKDGPPNDSMDKPFPIKRAASHLNRLAQLEWSI